MQYDHELDRYRITNAQTLKNCMLGGLGTVCLVAPSNKAHTYRFVKPVNSDQFPDDVIFVHVLHKNKYNYIGMIERSRFRLTRNSRFPEDTESVKGAKYLVTMMNNEEAFNQSSMKFYHAGRCACCGRKMRSAKAISAGVGPKCLARLKAKIGV